MATFLDTALRPVGIAVLVSGIATLSVWYFRYRGAERPPQLRLLGSAGVIAAVGPAVGAS